MHKAQFFLGRCRARGPVHPRCGQVVVRSIAIVGRQRALASEDIFQDSAIILHKIVDFARSGRRLKLEIIKITTHRLSVEPPPCQTPARGLTQRRLHLCSVMNVLNTDFYARATARRREVLREKNRSHLKNTPHNTQVTYIPDGSYFPIHKITEPAALTRSIAVHTTGVSRSRFF